jgi:hypothetical protein
MNNSDGCVAAREAEIPHENSHLGATIEHLQKSVEILNQRLQSVLRPESPTPGQLAKPTASPVSPLGGSLHESATKLTRLIDRIEDLTNRCELGG